MRRFLAIHALPTTPHGTETMDLFTRVAEAAHEVGAHPVETTFSVERGRAYSLFEARDEDAVVAAHRRAGIDVIDVFPAERLHTDLLDEPRRAR